MKINHKNDPKTAPLWMLVLAAVAGGAVGQIGIHVVGLYL